MNQPAPEPQVTRAVEALQTGRQVEESFRVLHATYYRPVQRFFAKRVRSPDVCLDLTQETFLRVYRGVGGYRGDAPFGAWLYRIAWNVLHRHRSRGSEAKRRRLEVPLEDRVGETERIPAEPPSKDTTQDGAAFARVLESERREILRRAIAKLPDQRRRCLILWAYRELTYEQIAQAMRLSLGTVKAHLAQARKQLEGLVEDLMEDSRMAE